MRKVILAISLLVVFAAFSWAAEQRQVTAKGTMYYTRAATFIVTEDGKSYSMPPNAPMSNIVVDACGDGDICEIVGSVSGEEFVSITSARKVSSGSTQVSTSKGSDAQNQFTQEKAYKVQLIYEVRWGMSPKEVIRAFESKGLTLDSKQFQQTSSYWLAGAGTGKAKNFGVSFNSLVFSGGKSGAVGLADAYFTSDGKLAMLKLTLSNSYSNDDITRLLSEKWGCRLATSKFEGSQIKLDHMVGFVEGDTVVYNEGIHGVTDLIKSKISLMSLYYLAKEDAQREENSRKATLQNEKKLKELY